MSCLTNTMVFPVVRSDLIVQCLDSFWQYSDRDTHRVIVVDQSKNGLPDLVGTGLAHLVVRSYRNLGFSKACNTGIRLSDTEYVTVCNDDTFFFDARWWSGITKVFERVQEACAINPSTPRMPGWGFGKDGYIHIADIGSREKCTNDGVWELLMDKTPLRGLCRGICTWCTTFSMPRLRQFNVLGDRGQLFDEHWYPGSGEDYDLNARIFRAGGIAVGTHESWVWHDWGKSKDFSDKDMSRPSWNKIGDLWEPGFTPQGGSARKTTEVWIDEL